MYVPTPEEAPLAVELRDGKLIISVGTSTLSLATSGGCGDTDSFFVVSDALFAKAVARELVAEDEAGDTPVTRMLTQAARRAVEGGCEGVNHDWKPSFE
jgi:hypothetical protein